MSEIKTSLDYDKFKRIIGNREVVEVHAKQLAVAVELNDLLPYFPILINENWEVIDGQHRLEASKRLKKPVYYIQVAGLDLEDVQNINTSSRRWSIMDYIESWIKVGKKDYQTLLDFHKRTGINITICAGMLVGNLGGGSGSGGGHASNQIKTGEFKITNRGAAEEVALWVDWTDDICEFDPRKTRTYVAALYACTKLKAFDIDILLKKAKQYDLKVELQPSSRHFLLELERVYNHNNKIRINLFNGEQKEQKK